MVHIGESESTLYDYIDNAIASLVTSGSGTDRVQNDDVGHSSVESSDNSFPTGGNSTESDVSNQSNNIENEGRHGRSIPTARNNETNPETSKPIIIRVRDQVGFDFDFLVIFLLNIHPLLLYCSCCHCCQSFCCTLSTHQIR